MSGKVKNKEGRPTKYKPEYCELLIQHLTNGFTYESFPARIPDNTVHLGTLYDWEKMFPEFSEAKSRGKAMATLYWDSIAMSVSKGEILKDTKGRVIVDPKKSVPSVLIFNLKNRIGWRDNPVEKDTQDHKKDLIVINRYVDKKEEEKKEEVKIDYYEKKSE